MFQLADLYNKCQRSKKEPEQLCAIVTSWGGQVLDHRPIARLRDTPFSGWRTLPMLYEIRARHGDRLGFWFVRTSSDGGPPDWAWLDDDGRDSLPIPVVDAALACGATPVSWASDWMLVAVAMAIVAFLVAVLLPFA